MQNGGLILWNAVAIQEMFKIPWHMGDHLVRDDSENHFEGPVIPFGATVDYHPISTKGQSRLYQIGKKVLPRIFLGYALVAGEPGKEMFWLLTLRSWEN